MSLQAEELTVDQLKPVSRSAASIIGPLREYGSTLATESTVLIAQVLAYKLAAYYLGKDGFAEYAITRRAATFICPLPLLGLSVALPRFIAMSQGREDQDAISRYFGASLICVVLVTLACSLILNLGSGVFAFLLFGNRSYAAFMWPLSLMVWGLSLHAVVYAYFRGKLAMMQANILQLINLGVVPILSFFLLSRSTVNVVVALGALWTVVAAIALCFTPVRSVFKTKHETFKELLCYGIQRVPGDLIFLALMTLPVTFAAHLRGVELAGFVAFGISVLSMIGAALKPIGLVLLPKASLMLASNKGEELKLHVKHLAWVTFIFAGAATILLEITAPILMRLYLGSDFTPIVPIIRMTALGAIPFAIYYALRGLVDAYHSNAINALNVSITFVVFLLLSAGLFYANAVTLFVLPTVVALYVLGALTIKEAREIVASPQAS